MTKTKGGKVPQCPIHGRDLVCPSCAAIERGRKGGEKTSAEKAKTARENAAKARKKRHPK
jgi:hypothetical protein